jgi:plastocyanin
MATKALRLRRVWWLPVVLLGALAAGMNVPVSATNLHLAHPSEGLICTLGSGGAKTTNPSFVLTARDGYITTPDGNSIYMWSYANGNQDFQYPGPYMCVNEGDTVSITLKNTLPNNALTSIQFTGIPQVKVDGGIPQPNASTSSLSKAAANGGTVTYTFTASHPGTFLYESGTDPQLQVQMGLAGALVVRPAAAGFATCTTTGADPCTYAYDDAYSRFDAKHEYVHLLSEIDPDLHHWIELGNTSYDWSKYNARYWMINGRSFPDDIAPNNVSNLPTQPYGSLVHVQSREVQPDPALIRYLNIGPVGYPFHPHSNHESSIGIDGHQLVTPTGGDASFERFDLVVAPGQTIDATFTWEDAQHWAADTNPVGAPASSPGGAYQGVPIPEQQDRFEGPYWNGSPYLGDLQPLATGVVRYNECGEFYHVAHSHALFQVTNFGFSGGGMLTMVRVDPSPELQAKYGVTCTVPGN